MTPASSFPSNSRGSATPARSASTGKNLGVGVLLGAVVGGAIGALVAKKPRGGRRKPLLPAQVPQAGQRALTVAKRVASEAADLAKAVAAKAAEQAVDELKSGALQLAAEAVQGDAPDQREVPPTGSTPTDARAIRAGAGPRASVNRAKRKAHGQIPKKKSGPTKRPRPRKTPAK